MDSSPASDTETAALAGARPPELVRKLARQLMLGRQGRARQLFEELCANPLELELHLNHLQKQAVRGDGLDLLFDLLQEAGPPVLSRIQLIAKAAEIGQEAGRQEEALDLVLATDRQSQDNLVRFCPEDHIASVCRASRLKGPIRDRLLAIKYRGLTIDQPEDLFDAADRLSERVDLDEALVEHLHSLRQDRSISLVDWDRRMRVACAIDHIISDRPPSASGTSRVQSYMSLIDRAEITEAFGPFSDAEGLVLATFHGGVVPLAQELFSAEFKEGLLFQTGVSERSISMKQDARAALVLAVRAAMSGKAMCMAPDGRLGNRPAVAVVGERRVQTANGVAMILYESGCASAWYTVVSEGRRLVPIVVPAPRPAKGETFETFAERWLAFYWSRVEDMMTGNPDRIALRRRWARLSSWSK